MDEPLKARRTLNKITHTTISEVYNLTKSIGPKKNMFQLLMSHSKAIKLIIILAKAQWQGSLITGQ